MVSHSRSKRMLVALGVAAIGFTIASCGAENTDSLVGPAPAGVQAPSSASNGPTATTEGNSGVIVQLVPFFYPDGTEVVSVNGEADDAVLNRFAAQLKQRIIWQFMTQHLTPGETYDIWLEGSNDGADSFNWWLGKAKANAGGDLNAIGTVYAGRQPGPGVGTFTNPLAPVNLIIKTTSGTTMQTASFPAP